MYSPAMNAMREQISPSRTPRAMSNESDSSKLPSGSLTRTTSVAAAKIKSTGQFSAPLC